VPLTGADIDTNGATAAMTSARPIHSYLGTAKIVSPTMTARVTNFAIVPETRQDLPLTANSIPPRLVRRAG
jgi:hypothetical protein